MAMEFRDQAINILRADPDRAAQFLGGTDATKASEILREMRHEDSRRTAKILALMDPADANKLCFHAGLEPGGDSTSTGHAFSSTDVYNSIKRIIAFSDLVRKNKAVKQVLETSAESASKLAFEVLLEGGDVPEILDQLAHLKIQRAGLAGNKFGPENARRLYEETVGDILEDHMEYPLHPDPQEESLPDAFFVVEGTFVHIPIPSSMYSTPSIHATTV